jgi:hypothetical protein
VNEKKLREAATDLGENVMWLIEQVLVKHNMAIIEASKEAVDAAVLAEREACAQVCDTLGDEFADVNPAYCAAAIRERGAP